MARAPAYNRRRKHLCLIIAGMSLSASLANAQGALEEVVVTAQKREQSLQDEP